MDVLLILGNGFDLNLGLPTAYSHFYDYYLNKPHLNSQQGSVLKQSLSEWKNNAASSIKNIINWSDLELGLGDVSLNYSTVNSYLDDFDDISLKLTNYLQSVEKLEIKNIEKIANAFIDDILRVALLTDLDSFISDNYKKTKESVFSGYLDFKPSNEMSEFLNSTSNLSLSALNIDVMTFNYTNTAERIFKTIRQLAFPKNKISLGKILHIHQDLGEAGIVLGVNSIDQIANEDFRSLYPIKYGIVKPNLVSEYAAGTDVECINAISKADVIIFFGVSLGMTDSIWWKRIGNLVSGSNKRIIYCRYEQKEDFAYTSRAVVNKIHEYQEFLFDRFYISDSVKNDMRKKVYPVRKNQMFDFRIVEDLAKLQNDNLNSVINTLLIS